MAEVATVNSQGSTEVALRARAACETIKVAEPLCQSYNMRSNIADGCTKRLYPEVVGLQDATILTARCTTELRRAEDEFERGDFSPGDEATINAALVNLITVLSMLLKMRGCVHHDRTNYSILSGDRKTELYRAGVDGLILHAGKDRVNVFIKVKRDFRGRNQAVRRQIAAQMAAFIYHQNIELARQETKHNKRDIVANVPLRPNQPVSSKRRPQPPCPLPPNASK